MASVTPVQTSELRPNSPSPQAPKSGDPFAMLLETVDAKRATPPEPRRRPEAPDAPRVHGAEKPERAQPRQNTKAMADKNKPVAPEAKDCSAPEQTKASENKVEANDTNSGQQTDGAAVVDADAATEEVAALPATIEGSPEAPASGGETVADGATIDADKQPLVTAEASVVNETNTPAQAPVQQITAADAAAVPAPAAAVEAVVDIAQEGAAVAAAVKAETASGKQVNNQAALTADAEAATMDEAAPQTAAQPEKAEAATHAEKPVVSNHAEARNAAIAEKDEQAPQNTGASKPEIPAQAKEHASAKAVEHAPAQSTVENSAPRQQAVSQTMPVLPEPVRALAGSINPVNLRAANDGRDNAVPLNANAIGVEIASRAKDGMRRFDIRLDPAELGRIDVRMEVGSDGKTSLRLVVERPETLDLLQRDARNLERAMQSAGLQTDEGGMEFSLRDQGQNGLADAGTNGGYDRRDDFLASAIEDAEQAPPALERYARSVLARGGVDIRI